MITDEPQDFIDAYLKELEKKDGLDPSFNENTLVRVCNDIFTAGADTIGSSIGFCLLYTVLYPKWQDVIYEEIKQFRENETGSLLDNRKRFCF